jgi:hypothetical protein
MTDTTDFDAQLKRAFALADQPSDDSFTQALSARVAASEGRRRLGRGAQAVLMGFAGGAGAFGLWQSLQTVGPGLMAAAGPDLAMLVTAQLPVVSFGMPVLMGLGAAAGAGVVWLRRSAD